MTGSITWNNKKQGVDQVDFVCNRHPKFLSGFEIWYKKKHYGCVLSYSGWWQKEKCRAFWRSILWEKESESTDACTAGKEWFSNYGRYWSGTSGKSIGKSGDAGVAQFTGEDDEVISLSPSYLLESPSFDDGMMEIQLQKRLQIFLLNKICQSKTHGQTVSYALYYL